MDPVLDQTITTLRELVAEGEAKPASRKASARAIEATLGIQAAHIGLHYDAAAAARSAASSGARRPRGTDRRDGEVGARPQASHGDARARRRRCSRNWSRADSRVACAICSGRFAPRASTRLTPFRPRRFGRHSTTSARTSEWMIEIAESAAGIICCHRGVGANPGAGAVLRRRRPGCRDVQGAAMVVVLTGDRRR